VTAIVADGLILEILSDNSVIFLSYKCIVRFLIISSYI
jgi:hypothetical protein